MTWAIGSTLLGAAIIVYGLSDVFLTLVHPHARGRMTRGIVAGVWRLTSRLGGRARAAAGPLATLGVVLSWTAAQAVGWALVYLPHVPEGFSYAEGIDPGRYHDASEALYMSLVSLSTVGFGEVVAIEPTIRLLAAVEAVTGFALLTASATWLLQLFPTLARRRTAALSLSLLGQAGYAEQLEGMDAASASAVLHEAARQIASVRVDLGQSPESYYFREGEKPTSLGHALPIAVALAERAQSSTMAAVRGAGGVLNNALDDLGTCLRDNFDIRGDSRAELIAAFARDHA
ncbi:MAG TPA: transporter [Microbacterium sp.]|nr:transporter [Microbacterium sp.]